MTAPREEDVEALVDRIQWYVKCYADFRDGRVVRGLSMVGAEFIASRGDEQKGKP